MHSLSSQLFKSTDFNDKNIHFGLSKKNFFVSLNSRTDRSELVTEIYYFLCYRWRHWQVKDWCLVVHIQKWSVAENAYPGRHHPQLLVRNRCSPTIEWTSLAILKEMNWLDKVMPYTSVAIHINGCSCPCSFRWFATKVLRELWLAFTSRKWKENESLGESNPCS